MPQQDLKVLDSSAVGLEILVGEAVPHGVWSQPRTLEARAPRNPAHKLRQSARREWMPTAPLLCAASNEHRLGSDVGGPLIDQVLEYGSLRLRMHFDPAMLVAFSAHSDRACEVIAVDDVGKPEAADLAAPHARVEEQQ